MLGGRVSTLEDMMKKNYRWKENKNKRKSMRCNNRTFGDTIRGR